MDVLRDCQESLVEKAGDIGKVLVLERTVWCQIDF